MLVIGKYMAGTITGAKPPFAAAPVVAFEAHLHAATHSNVHTAVYARARTQLI